MTTHTVHGNHEHKEVPGYHQDKEDLLARLRRIEGQVRGLQRMVSEGRYCIDVLTQVSAIQAALHRVGLVLLAGHTRSCVADAIRSGDDHTKIDELMAAIERFTR